MRIKYIKFNQYTDIEKLDFGFKEPLCCVECVEAIKEMSVYYSEDYSYDYLLCTLI